MKRRGIYLSLLSLILALCLSLFSCDYFITDTGSDEPLTEVPQNVVIAGEKIPAYKSSGYYVVNGNKPLFKDDEITSEGFYEYTDLDYLGRAGVAFGCIGPETLPKDDREDISHITPSGWRYNGKSNNNQYDASTGVNGYIYNRAHLLANQLVSDDVDERNFITGTCDMNQKHMVKFENMIADYVKETDGHVMYRVTPYFEGKNLVCSGVLMEGYSVEDNGESVEFCVFVYNVQPNIYINYLTGENSLEEDASLDTEDEAEMKYSFTEDLSVGTAYKIAAIFTSGTRFFNGDISNGMQTIDKINRACDVYLESAGEDGQYYLYFYDGGEKTYIIIEGNTTTSIEKSSTPDTYWIYDSASGELISSYDSGHSLGNRGLAIDPERADIRAYYESDIGNKYVPIKFAVVEE